LEVFIPCEPGEQDTQKKQPGEFSMGIVHPCASWAGVELHPLIWGKQ